MSPNKKRTNGKTNAVIALCVLLAVTILLGVVGFTGASFLNVSRWLPTSDSDNWPEALPLGLDLQGGVYVEYTGEPPAGSDASFEDLVDGTISIIRDRLTNVGQTEANIQRIGTNGIRVEIPIKNNAKSAAEPAAELNAAETENTLAPDEGTTEETPDAEAKTEDAGLAEGVPAPTAEDAGEAAAAVTETAAETAEKAEETAETVAENAENAAETATETATEAATETATEAADTAADAAEETAETAEAASDELDMTYIYNALAQDAAESSTATTIDFSDNDAIKQVLDLIGKTAKMRFVDPNGYIFMEGDMVKSARYVSVQSQSADSTSNQIEFQLTSEGAKIFGEYTTKYVGQYISIWLDNEQLVNARVNEPITNGTGLISGNYTAEGAQSVAARIQSGALPMILKQDKVDVVSASLGQDALSSSVTAAFIGILLIMLLMIFRYRLNGVIASWALTIYVILLFGLIALFKVQLTLPGLAGVVLGIGMAVDANVIIFERFNEEARKGRSAKASVRAGFKNAISAILDANVTTLIAAIVLLIFGTGSIQGFARTLLLGVVVSMFTAILVTRFLMNRFVDAGCTGIRLFSKVKAENAEEEVAQ